MDGELKGEQIASNKPLISYRRAKRQVPKGGEKMEKGSIQVAEQGERRGEGAKGVVQKGDPDLKQQDENSGCPLPPVAHSRHGLLQRDKPSQTLSMCRAALSSQPQSPPHLQN